MTTLSAILVLSSWCNDDDSWNTFNRFFASVVSDQVILYKVCKKHFDSHKKNWVRFNMVHKHA